MIFDQQIINDIREKEYSLYQYGSSCTNLLNARDIDIVSVSSEYESPYLKHYYGSDLIAPFNLYCVPENVFHQDIINLRYGGFFAHKFALNYRLIVQAGASCDAPVAFWAAEARAYYDIHGQLPSPKLLVLWTHFSIVSFNPTFGRSLSRYIRDKEAQILLVDQVTSILERLSKEGSPDFTISRNWRELLYRFLSTYQTFKNGSTLWGSNTLAKISKSCLEYEYSMITDYFREYDLTSVCSERANAHR